MAELPELPDSVRASVMRASEPLPNARVCTGYDFNQGVDYGALMASMATTGFQATHLGDGIATVNQMLNWRLSSEEILQDATDEEKTPEFREKTKCKIFLGYTSNLISSGVRETIRFLVQHRMVDVLVTTAGGIEEDFIKCLAPTFIGDFNLLGVALRAAGINRIGNLTVPNSNYCSFENWVTPILDQLLLEQMQQGIIWSPSKIIARLGKEINHPESIYYWAQKNGIPVYCPGLTDGSLGDMVFFHTYKETGFIIDIVQDIRGMNDEALKAGLRKTGIIVLGGGLPKHHICNANMMRNGADFSVFINTAQEYDGSDSGARPDEAISWGKLRGDSNPVKVHCDATIAFPLLVAETFAKKFHEENSSS